MNGIIIDGKVYEAKIGFDPNQCTRCDLSTICDDYFGDTCYPCKMFSPCSKVYFSFSQSLIDKNSPINDSEVDTCRSL